jgi:3-oxoadipate enol-lactonase
MPSVNLPTGVNLYYESHGSGEPLVLIPSTAFSAEVWKPYQVPGLSKALNLVIHDPRGTGRSTASQQVYTINQMANDVVALLDHLEIGSAHVLGHSMGGRIGLEMALNFPGRVKSLIMAASGSGQAARPGPDCIPGLPHWLVIRLVEKGFERRCAKSFAIPAPFSPMRFENNTRTRSKSFSSWRGRPTPTYPNTFT